MGITRVGRANLDKNWRVKKQPKEKSGNVRAYPLGTSIIPGCSNTQVTDNENAQSSHAILLHRKWKERHSNKALNKLLQDWRSTDLSLHLSWCRPVW